MSFINYAGREITLKLVYYGPGLSGKTTNVRQLHGGTAPERRGQLIELATEAERTLMFDFAPLAVGQLHGFNLRFHVYSVPGQIFYAATRRLIVRGSDAIVFVADSQEARVEANVESLENLEHDLHEHFGDPAAVPCIIQYNKRDQSTALPIAALQRALNPRGLPEFEAIAANGFGVQTTARAAMKLALRAIQRDLGMLASA
jgi:signal recognition particle receptor subunit beta